MLQNSYYRKIFIVFALSLLILLVFIAFVGPFELFKSLQSFNLFYAVAFLLVLFSSLSFRAIRWSVLSVSEAQGLQLQTCWLTMHTIAFLAIFLPARIGEISRPFLAKKESDIPISITSTIILGENLLDSFLLLLIAFSLTVLLIHSISLATIIPLLILMGFLVFIYFLAFITFLWIGENVLPRVSVLPERMMALLLKIHRSVMNAIQILRKNPRGILYSVILSLLIWAAELQVIALSYYGLGYSEASYAVLLMAATVGYLSFLIPPILPQHLGIYEAAVASVLLLYGIEIEIIVIVVLMQRILRTLYAMVLGGITFFIQGLSISEMLDITR
ncbi:MAG: lysylphosphatidylglycerol synthase transmembrane domain-containing protein [Candidatus Heimdallarchaeota archaeon]